MTVLRVPYATLKQNGQAVDHCSWGTKELLGYVSAYHPMTVAEAKYLREFLQPSSHL